MHRALRVEITIAKLPSLFCQQKSFIFFFGHNQFGAKKSELGRLSIVVEKMDISEETNASAGILEDSAAEEDSRCNWDIEIITFVVDSFICLFPEKERKRSTRARQDSRGELPIVGC